MKSMGGALARIQENYHKEVGIEPEKENIRFVMANDQEIVCSIGFTMIPGDEVVLAKKGDLRKRPKIKTTNPG